MLLRGTPTSVGCMAGLRMCGLRSRRAIKFSCCALHFGFMAQTIGHAKHMNRLPSSSRKMWFLLRYPAHCNFSAD